MRLTTHLRLVLRLIHNVTLPYLITARYLIKHMNNLTFTLLHQQLLRGTEENFNTVL